MIKKTCITCKKKFQAAHWRQLTCSIDCKIERRRHNARKGAPPTPINRVCIICGNKFQLRSVKQNKKITCSYDCSKERHRQLIKDWQIKNRKKVTILALKWQKNNPKKVKATRRNHYLKNRTKEYEQSKLWRKNNPEIYRTAARRHYRKDIKFSRFRSNVFYQKQRLANEILRTIDPTISLWATGSITFLKELGIDITQIMENIDVD